MPTQLLSRTRDEFAEREVEIENFYRFVRGLLTKSARIETDDPGSLVDLNQVSLEKTLKASCVLLLYNLMEATTRNAVEAIFDELKIHGVSYDDCCEKLRIIVINHLKHEKMSREKLFTALKRVAFDVLTETFDKSMILSGSVDGRALIKLADQYGLAEPTGKQFRLQQIKDSRNALAHGNQTFEQVGRDLALSDLEEAKDQVFAFLSSFVDNTQHYLEEKHYLAIPPTSKSPVVIVSSST